MQTQVKSLKRKIEQLGLRIREIQSSCEHPSEHITKIANSDTGNWCRADDRYWYDCHCKLCDKHWSEDQ